jgi:hypothetical protein
MTPEQKRAYVLADNKLAMNAGWDEELLAESSKACSQPRAPKCFSVPSIWTIWH